MTATRDRRLAQLRQARLYLCTDASRGAGLAGFLEAAYRGGVDIIQLRDKRLEARAELEAIAVLAEVAHRMGKLFAVNDRADLAVLCGADILHLGQGDLTTEQARAVVGDQVLLGRSTHDVEQARSAAVDGGIDYFCTGPLWATPTKPGRAAVGLELPSAAAGFAGAKPFFGIGGIDTGNVAEVLAAGADRVVVVRAITEADDPEAAARALRQALPH